jgi:hypothetical protein
MRSRALSERMLEQAKPETIISMCSISVRRAVFGFMPFPWKPNVKLVSVNYKM